MNTIEKQRLHHLLDEEDYASLQKTVQRQYGFNLDVFIYSFLRRAVSSFMAYWGMPEARKLEAFLQKEEGNWATFITHLVPAPTELFRDFESWQYLRSELHDRAPGGGPKMRIWINGCSTGEVLASVLVLLHEQGLMDQVEIKATDLHPRILKQSQKMRFPKSKWSPSLKNYQLMGSSTSLPAGLVEEDQYFTILPELLEPVKFTPMLPHQLPEGPFDWIICQNVLIYYKMEVYRRACRNMKEALKPNGLLVMGSGEKLPFELVGMGMKPALEPNSLYRKTS